VSAERILRVARDGRLARLAGFWWRSIDARAVAWGVLLGCVWVAFYVFYFIHMSRA
jgi:hypothetical protein